jgi:hypothetical protein
VEHGQLVIKWMDNRQRALEHLSRYPLNELVQMKTARFWLGPPCLPDLDEDAAERLLDLHWYATQVLQAEEHGP